MFKGLFESFEGVSTPKTSNLRGLSVEEFM